MGGGESVGTVREDLDKQQASKRKQSHEGVNDNIATVNSPPYMALRDEHSIPIKSLHIRKQKKKKRKKKGSSAAHTPYQIIHDTVTLLYLYNTRHTHPLQNAERRANSYLKFLRYANLKPKHIVCVMFSHTLTEYVPLAHLPARSSRNSALRFEYALCWPRCELKGVNRKGAEREESREDTGPSLTCTYRLQGAKRQGKRGLPSLSTISLIIHTYTHCVA